jgi:hypothetical protein
MVASSTVAVNEPDELQELEDENALKHELQELDELLKLEEQLEKL